MVVNTCNTHAPQLQEEVQTIRQGVSVVSVPAPQRPDRAIVSHKVDTSESDENHLNNRCGDNKLYTEQKAGDCRMTRPDLTSTLFKKEIVQWT